MFVFFLEAVMAKFEKVTNNNLEKYLKDQPKYALDCLDGGGQKSLKEINSEVAEHKREPIQLKRNIFELKP